MQLSSEISAVITGGASGLGAATARRLAGHGVKVALFDLNEKAGEALAKELGGVFCKVDVTLEEQVDAGFAKARAHQGQERVLVNCAGTGNAIKTASRDKSTGQIKSFPSAHFDRIIQINLVGTFRCIAKSAAGMMTLPIARDLMGEGIRVNTILPGIFETPLLAGLPDNVKGALAASVPFPKRLGQPDEYAALAEFMLTTGYMNGESVRIDGAIRMAPR
jgi:NAD(P)-dependent dehydrogenase (short-subunit alcohol dehydrogenase family)